MKTLAHTLPVAARFMMALLFLISAYIKSVGFPGATGYYTKLGLPAPELFLGLSILLECVCAALLVMNRQLKIATVLLALFTVGAALIAHRFWAADPAQFNNQLNHFLKNIAIAGGLLALAFHAPAKAE